MFLDEASVDETWLPDNSRSESRDNLELIDEINARGGRVAEFN